MLSKLPWTPKPEAKPRQWKLSQERRRSLIERAADILRSGQPTAFALEGACRHGLRSGLCLDGWTWAAADIEARDIVSRALNQLGARRPTWTEGQPEHTSDGFAPIERTRCAHCAGKIPEDRGSRNGPTIYCSDLCSQGAAAHRARLSGEQVSRAEWLARAAARRERTFGAEIDCAHCGKPFRPGYNVNRQRFCSRTCADAGKVYHRLPERACVGCGATFKPQHGTAKYCSPECYQTRGPAPHRGEERTCPVCQSIFRVHSPKMPQVTCSHRCSWTLRKGRQASLG